MQTQVDRRSLADRLPLPELGLVGVAAVWGLTFPMVQDAIALTPTYTFLAYRFIPASLLVAVVFRRKLREMPGTGWRFGVLMGVFLTAGYVFQTLGLERTTASKAGFITGLFVVLTPVFGAILLRHPAGVAAWGAAVVSGIGLYLLSGASGGFNAGDGLVLLCACSFSFHILVTDRAVVNHDPGALLTVQLGVCGVFCLAVATARGDVEIPRSGEVWLALFVTAIAASAVGFFIQTYAQKHAPPARVALILASEPAFAGFFAWLLKGETLPPRGWTGAALILAAIVAVQLFGYLRPARPLPEG